MSKKNRTKPAFPKKVGDVKVPKHLRRVGAKLVASATSPAGLELIAAGLSMASLIASAAVERERARRRADVAVGDALIEEREAATIARGPQSPPASGDPHEIGVALGRMAEAALSGLLTRRA